MKQHKIATYLSLGLAVALFQCGCVTQTAELAATTSPASLDSAATTALNNLYANNPSAKTLGRKALAILVFPDVLKGGLMWGAEIGNGTLLENGRPVGHYNIAAASYGLQAGIQTFGYALFLMNDSAIAYLNKTAGLELGVGPSIVVVDQGMARTLSTSTLSADIYAFVFDQSGLMAGAGLQGSKITRVNL
jgi:lipid-binding SYLF domain-containing protein